MRKREKKGKISVYRIKDRGVKENKGRKGGKESHYKWTKRVSINDRSKPSISFSCDMLNDCNVEGGSEMGGREGD